ncbi:MAG: SDR family oxidoreductase, partial [Spirochaetales bacterium]|nr:SDR family oxidoreductase [Spirochaetales bacterium]
MRLSDKVALITGAGRGIGRATALAFAAEGANLVLADMKAQEVDETCKEVKKLGREAIAVAVNVTRKAEVASMVKQALDRFGNVDVLVNIAGVAIHNMIPAIREEDWDLNMDVNAKGIFLCTQALFTHMCDRGNGHIVNVASMSGKHGSAKTAAYAASKFAAIGFTESTMNEGRPHGVKATAICPGPVDTALRAGNWPDDIKEQLIKPEDVA